MSRVVYSTIVLSLCLSTATVRAQTAAMAELYGEAVHRFFSGDYAGADQLLTQVIASGSQDPRPYYFRGLVREMQGGGGEFDFQTGAKFEAEGKHAYAIGRALTRIQGHVRTKIEKARRDARVVAKQQRMLMQRAQLDGTVAPASGAAPAESLPPAAPSETGGADTDPFSGDGMRSEETTAQPDAPAANAAPEVDEKNDPFGDDPAPATPAAPDSTDGSAPSADSPFGTDGDTPAADADDPFGLDQGDGMSKDDPFGN